MSRGLGDVYKRQGDTDRELVVWSGSRYENYNMNRIKIHKGQLQQDIIKALNAEIERLEHLAEQLKGEL